MKPADVMRVEEPSILWIVQSQTKEATPKAMYSGSTDHKHSPLQPASAQAKIPGTPQPLALSSSQALITKLTAKAVQKSVSQKSLMPSECTAALANIKIFHGTKTETAAQKYAVEKEEGLDQKRYEVEESGIIFFGCGWRMRGGWLMMRGVVIVVVGWFFWCCRGDGR